MYLALKYIEKGDEFSFPSFSNIPWIVLSVGLTIDVILFKRHNGTKTTMDFSTLYKAIQKKDAIPCINGLEIACRQAKLKKQVS